ncbi:hypothetical protein B0H11DRAFT_1907460 [Mycena galericulata]|nr:hypothetical protein B0H11DRAFT_1907460 [Mycena galericulata]
MPPKGSKKLPSEEDFRYNEDRTKVQCRASSSGVPVERRTRIELRSAPAHLGYQTHLKAVEQLEDARRRQQVPEDERREESAALGLQDVQSSRAELRLVGKPNQPLPGGERPSVYVPFLDGVTTRCHKK